MHQSRSQTSPRHRPSDCPPGPLSMIVAQSEESDLQTSKSVPGDSEATTTFAHFFRQTIKHRTQLPRTIRKQIRNPIDCLS